MSEFKKKIIFNIPIFRDWDAVSKLIVMIDEALKPISHLFQIEILLIDDWMIEKKVPIFETPLQCISEINILRLYRNLGHQRAIAIGLSYIHANKKNDAVLVMDGDGEDTAKGVVDLLLEFENQQGELIILAKRQRRTENLTFRFFYTIYKFMHRWLTGRTIQVGNFSIVPSQYLDSLVLTPELWRHYAASILLLKLPCKLVPIDRGYRIDGKSTMNFTSFVIHGLSAISVYTEEVGVRLNIFLMLLTFCFSSGLAIVIGIRLFTDYAIPGWATNAFGFLLVTIFQLLIISLIIVLVLIKTRSNADFLPIRDYHYFIKEQEHIFP